MLEDGEEFYQLVNWFLDIFNQLQQLLQHIVD